MAKRRELAARVYTHFLRERFSTARPSPPGRSGEAASSSSPSSSSPPCSTCALRKPSASRCSRERLPVTSTSASAVAAAAVWRPALMPGSPLTTLSSAGPSWRAATLRHGRSLAPSHAHLVCASQGPSHGVMRDAHAWCITWREMMHHVCTLWCGAAWSASRSSARAEPTSSPLCTYAPRTCSVCFQARRVATEA